jgi:ATP-dependent DNA ligase
MEKTSGNCPCSHEKQSSDVLPSRSTHVLYVDHTNGAGQRLYELACRLDLEGIVAKRVASPYVTGEDWIKIKNPNYSQKEGRVDLFRRAG